jgi:hypothetical protein
MKLMWRGAVAPTPELDARRMIHSGRLRDRITTNVSSEFQRKWGAIASMLVVSNIGGRDQHHVRSHAVRITITSNGQLQVSHGTMRSRLTVANRATMAYLAALTGSTARWGRDTARVHVFAESGALERLESFGEERADSAV